MSDSQTYDSKLFNNLIGLVTIIDDDLLESPNQPQISKIKNFSQYGTLVKLISSNVSAFQLSNPFGLFREESWTMSALAVSRFQIESIQKTSPYYVANIKLINDEISQEKEKEILKGSEFLSLKKNALAYLKIKNPQGAFTKSYQLKEENNVVKINEIDSRIKFLNEYLMKQLEEEKMSEEFEKTIEKELNNQNEKIIENRLAKAWKESQNNENFDDEGDEIEELKRKIKKKNLPKEVQETLHKEMKRLNSVQSMHPAESAIIQNYIETLIDLPWKQETPDNQDLANAEYILNRDHAGLKNIKQRILEFLAVRYLKGNQKGTILCFHGPPGTGKTSLGKSIADSLNRKFARISLGGINDEAEIRGHRRTYVGAMPGMIISTLRKCQNNNPVILLDEIDKLGHSQVKGDPSSALLEVLDPAQNFSFRDNYVGLPFDLSNVFFIATANTIETIQPALRDRLELIQLTGYTTAEKLLIAQQFLVPKQIIENGLTEQHIQFQDDTLTLIIRGYTREAGVRQLERNLGSVCRSVSYKLTKHLKANPKEEFEKIIVKPDELQDILGALIYEDEIRDKIISPGIAIGLAWTEAGGKILYIETSKSKGKGQIQITGSLGDVMRESVLTAIGWIKSNIESLGISQQQLLRLIKTSNYEKQQSDSLNIFNMIDFHVHCPSVAIPKDGPSAGITIATALCSLLLGRKVRPDVAMTGEITLSGLVLPVGGIKEKVLAAYTAGIKKIILPKRNKNDLTDLPSPIIEEIDFIFANTIQDVLLNALEKEMYPSNQNTNSEQLKQSKL